jgi:AAA+ superfamily predicted ATPase
MAAPHRADALSVDNSADLRVLLRSQNPLIFVETRDEQRFLALLCRVAEGLGLPVWTWSAARGLARNGHEAVYRTMDPRMALAFVTDVPDPGIFVFADAHHAIADPVVLRSVKDTAQQADRDQTLVLTGPDRTVPPELEGLAVPWTLRPPDEKELARLVRRTVEDLALRNMAAEIGAKAEADLVTALRGVTLSDAERLLQRAVLRDGALGPDDVAYVRSAKAELLNADGVLELIASHSGTLEDVGGLDHLKSWLEIRGAVMAESRTASAGLDPPRGILLTGVPGCGKSLIAKALANSWGRPLVLLDPSRLYGRYVGESEQRLDGALATVGAMAPIVLWIDEIEKGFAVGGDGDGGVSRRLLGTFLRWLQDRTEGVFVVATANDVGALPPELLRKGRFDEIFFVDLPGLTARREILAHHLRTRNHDPAEFDLDKLTEITSGFSGAEIEAVVVGALYRAFGAGGSLTTEELVAEVQHTVPLSISRAEDVSRFRAWASGRAVSA